LVPTDHWKCMWHHGRHPHRLEWTDSFSSQLLSHLYISDCTEPNSPLANIVQQAKTMTTAQKAELLENSDELEAAHTSFSQQGQSHAPAAEDEVETHYVALVKHVNPTTGKPMIYELDGRRKGPVERVELPADEDLIGPTALKIVEEFVKRESESGKQDFSLCALAPAID
jgi:ubiquitin carboxyl-terminal hydrolase L3